ncbi:uncharacterized protein LOC131950487 [Physella acuta]|uniref:uncharacterized protein LOC131950487 n=1 Tax=Physella acuta TaxID=109671 RepID=UPI0027DE1311|nr:uncharacterized protein LOC131950487 [Physella acuta]XP_059168658.1 uncharacterized protein LOC131950487 [Physella acuta]XP_059168659.1 uncharacterized protein LOC131950487 [Physella acuta]XP_059168660.1 uncharacterized protein LOC131950487 [Physella acuta]
MEKQEYIPGLEEDASKSGEIQIDGADLITDFPSLDDNEFDNSAISRTEVLDYGDECFLLKSVLLPEECQHFIQAGERVGFSEILYSRDDYRSSQRLSFQSSKLASILWKRIQGHLKTIVIDQDPLNLHIEGVPLLMKGTWVPKGLNDVFRLARYKVGGHFAPHNDGFFVRSATERSLQTFMVYLNGDFSGGSTNFIDTSQKLYKGPDGKYCAEEKNILCKVKPETGLAIIFNHNRLHEGEKLGSGTKYILRTDIMFENIAPCNLSSKQDTAILMLQEADRLEAAGKCIQAMELFRKAYKLCPELEETNSTFNS